MHGTLITYCNRKEIEVTRFTVRPPKMVTIKTKGWGSTESLTSFSLVGENQIISIQPNNPTKTFSSGFYDSIKPENIIKFIKFED